MGQSAVCAIRNGLIEESLAAAKATEGVISRGVVIRPRLRHTSNANSSAIRSAVSRSLSVTTRTANPSSGTSNQGWTGKMEMSSTGPSVIRSASLRTSDIGPHVGAHALGGNQKGSLGQAHDGIDLTADRGGHQAGDSLSGRPHVDVRFGVITHYHVRQIHHPGRQVGMQIQTHSHRRVPKAAAGDFNQRRVGVEAGFGGHRPMERQHQPIEFSGVVEAGFQ